MSSSGSFAACLAAADDQFGPRVDIACRPFDFTLLFEDAFLVALPAGAFLLLLPSRLRTLWKAPVKMSSYQLATWKLGMLFILFTCHLLFLILRTQTPQLFTHASVSSGVLSSVAILGAGVQSILEDQRSIAPSDALVLYFSASTILSIARLRSFWLIPSALVPSAIWTTIFVGSLLVVFLESARKAKFLRPVYRNATAEQLASFWSRSFYIWVLPFFQDGHSKVLGLADIPRADVDLEEDSARTKLEASWDSTHGRYRLIRAATKAYLWPLLSAIVPRLVLSAFTLCQPFVIESSVSYIRSGPANGQSPYGPALIGGVVLVYLGIAVSRAVYWRQTYRLISRIRSGLIAKIYRHTTSLRAIDVKDSAALTLMGTDVERIVQSLRFFHELWASVLEVAVAVWLLALRMSYASATPVVICAASVAATSYIATNTGSAQTKWVERVQRRVAVTASMLSDMKAVKMLGLENTLSDVVLQLRKLELKTSERFRGLYVWMILAGNAPATLGPFATFAIYAIIAVARKDETLLGAQAFASLSLIALVMQPLNTFCQALPRLFQAIASFTRIEDYFSQLPNSIPPASRSLQTPPSLPLDVPLDQVHHSSLPGSRIVSFEDADIAWSSDTLEPVLRNLTLTIRPGLNAIIGPVASGKSTLLSSIIGETTVTRGHMSSSLSGVAFCSQTPWIMDSTIRHNITGGGVLDEEWYRFSIMSCGLQSDIDAMPNGDQTLAGSNGASLSGGQRQRVSLARAVYSRLPIIILDDVMSGLDPTTAGNIMAQLFSSEGHFRKAGISVIIATHNRRVLPYMDTIFVLANGRLVESGSYNSINIQMAGLSEFSESDSLSVLSVQSKETWVESGKRIDTKSGSPPTAAPVVGAGEADIHRRNGTWGVYAYYYRCAGTVSVVLWISFTIIEAVTINLSPIWVQKWTEANEKAPNQHLGLYIGIYALLIVLSTLAVAAECRVFFVSIINNTALALYADLLKSTLRAPISFFQKTDTGSITNRFSQDMDLIDMTLPSTAIQFTTGAAAGVVNLVILCVVGKYLAATAPFFIAVLYFVQRYYLRTSRQLRLIDIEAKAPLYKHFIETVSGISTIRAFRWAPTFHDSNATMLDESQRPFYMLFCIQQWLTLVLDLIVGALAVVLVGAGTSSAGSVSAGSVGVALVLLLDFSGYLSQSIKAWTALETSIGAVARVQQFVQETPSEIIDAEPPIPQWPSRGRIQLDRVVACYGPDSMPTLVDVSLDIAPGEKIAVCGPSGSGKTSLIMAILRMMDVKGGRITIDDVDVLTLQGNDVRSRLDVVPQEPFFIPGTARFNLDPHNRSSTESIESAIRRVGLWERISAAGGPDADMVTSEWSHGEKQLLCLARAILVPSTILILDEATSSVDERTETIMQEVIDTQFRDRTVISVLHRFRYIDHFDRVAVLKSGKLVECDSPQALLSRESAFLELYREHNSQQR